MSAVAAAAVAVLRSARALGLLDPDDPSRVSRRVAEAAARTFVWEPPSLANDDGTIETEEATRNSKEDDDTISYGVDASLLHDEDRVELERRRRWWAKSIADDGDALPSPPVAPPGE